MKKMIASLLAASMSIALAGCSGGGGGHSPEVATVNGEVITQDDFYNRMQSVSAANLNPQVDPNSPHVEFKAGEFAMRKLIEDKLVMQFAKDNKVLPTEPQITTYIAFAKKYRDPLLPPDPSRSEADWRRDGRTTVAFRNTLTKLSNITTADVKKQYDANVSRLKEPDTDHLRLIDIKSRAKAEQILAALNKGVPFETEALKESEDPVSRAKNGDIGFVPENYLEQSAPGIFAAIKKLKPGDYAKQIVEVQAPARNAPPGAPPAPEKRCFLVQLVEKKIGSTPTMEQVRPLLEFSAINEKDPSALQRLGRQMQEFQQKAKITVALKPYEHLAKKTPPPTGGGPGPGSPGAPSMPSPGRP